MQGEWRRYDEVVQALVPRCKCLRYLLCLSHLVEFARPYFFVCLELPIWLRMSIRYIAVKSYFASPWVNWPRPVMEIYIKWIGEHCTTKRLTKMQPFYPSYIQNFIFGKSVLAHLVCAEISF